MRVAYAALLVLFAAQAGEGQKFRVAVDAVRVDALVIDGSRPVAGLVAADFELRDSGVLQQIESVALEDAPLSVMLVLDTSTSVSGEPLTHLKQAASAAVALLMPADRGAVMAFSGGLRLASGWTSDHRALDAAIAPLEAAGSTALHDAAYAALTLRDPQPGRTLVLIFSDGADTASWLPGQQVLDIARRNDAVVYAVTLNTGDLRVPGFRLDFKSGIQAPIRNAPSAALMEPFLDVLTAETGGKSVNALRSDRLRETFVQMVKEFRSRYLLTYTPRGVDRGGWHPVEVKLKGRHGKVTARRGYLR